MRLKEFLEKIAALQVPQKETVSPLIIHYWHYAEEIIEWIQKYGTEHCETSCWDTEDDPDADPYTTYKCETHCWIEWNGIKVTTKKDFGWDTIEDFIGQLPDNIPLKRLYKIEKAKIRDRREMRDAKRKEWLEKTEATWRLVKEWFNQLSDEDKKKLLYALDPYDGYFGDPGMDVLVKQIKAHYEELKEELL